MIFRWDGKWFYCLRSQQFISRDVLRVSFLAIFRITTLGGIPLTVSVGISNSSSFNIPNLFDFLSWRPFSGGFGVNAEFFLVFNVMNYSKKLYNFVMLISGALAWSSKYWAVYNHFVKVGILIARVIMFIYIDLENGLQKKRMSLYLFAINNKRDRIYEFISGIYKCDYLSRNLYYLSNIDEIVAHPRGFEPLASWTAIRCSIQLSYGCN